MEATRFIRGEAERDVFDRLRILTCRICFLSVEPARNWLRILGGSNWPRRGRDLDMLQRSGDADGIGNWARPELERGRSKSQQGRVAV